MRSEMPAQKALMLKAARCLARREHSREELRQKLFHTPAAQAPDTALVEAALDKLENCGALSDVRFAQQRARELAVYKYYAPRRIAADLCARGVDRETAEQAAGGYGETEQLRALLDKHPYDAYERRDRAKLERLGYSAAAIKKVCRAPGTAWED